MALAASLVTVIAVSKDKIKAELEERLKRKNPTIIYRGGSRQQLIIRQELQIRLDYLITQQCLKVNLQLQERKQLTVQRYLRLLL